jgi:transposase
MWEFRTRPEELTPEQQADLDDLFQRIPFLGYLYHFRWELTNVFETAVDRNEAEQRIAELREIAAESEFAEELEEFFGTYDRWKESILAYFKEGKSSGPVEGINNKARVVTRRSFGIKSPQALWQRLVLDINLAAEATGYTLERIKTLTRGIKAKFCGYYT